MGTLCFKGGISGIAPYISISGSFDARSNSSQVSAVGRSTTQKSPSIFSRFSFNPLNSLWPGRHGNSSYNGLAIDDAIVADKKEGKAIQEDNESGDMGPEEENGYWIFKMLDVNSLWTGNGGAVEDAGIDDHRNGCGGDDEECDACRVGEDDEAEVEFNRDSFSRMLRRVSLAEARLYAQMSYLGNLAYSIPKIKPRNLRYYGLRFVTSSIVKMELATAAEKNETLAETQEVETNEDKGERNEENENYSIRESVAYQVVASAASYLHAQTKSILPFDFAKTEDGDSSLQGSSEAFEGVDELSTEVASVKATTDSMTAVVAAKEEVKQAVADDLNLTCSSPCEWYICDDDQSGTRFFVIQGSESLASWQANLLFEPIQFEGFEVLVHRGIYEAAKGIYQQMLPEVHAHLKALDSRATLRFTGHSLGGSLALLINLMLLVRKEVPFSSMLPVITFGAPCIMCGGDSLLETLGLPRNHVQAITLHRDIVSRAFSCNYPYRIADLLKAVNGKFRNHSCLNNQNILYAPMGKFLILQPDDSFSPHHHLLPPGSGLYLLSGHFSESKKKDKHLQAAQLVFLNSPHPLEILSDRSAYGSGGTIIRDHDMKSYLKALRTVIREELNSIRKARREQWHNMWWSLLAPRNGTDVGIVVGRSMKSDNVGNTFNFSGILQIRKVMEKIR